MSLFEMVESVWARTESPSGALDVEESPDSCSAMRGEVVRRAPAMTVEASYAQPYSAPRSGVGSAVVRYCPVPVWLPAETPSSVVRPIDGQAGLVDRMFDAAPAGRGDVAGFLRGHVATEKQRAHLLLEQLAARRAVSREICREILEEECRVESQLCQFAYPVQGMGCESRFASDLARELQALRREARAERVACWQDTTRFLCELCERWSEYGSRWAGR